MLHPARPSPSRRLFFPLLAVTAFAALGAASTACGDDAATGGSGGGSGGSAPACEDYAGVTGSPSFKDDVMPIFALSCALSTSCHQSPNGKENLSLGPSQSMGAPDQATLDAVHAGLVGAASVRSSLPLVDPGNPAGSWLLAKLEYEGDEYGTCDASTQCGDQCGDRMPQNGSKMERERIDVIAAWIASGAPNN